ncbi:MAG: hypothetical protein ABIN89_26185 [Chitinophagaceae bacterium]
MKVVINEREYEYVSDYPKGWMFNSRHYFKCPVMVGKSNCFIKRFEIKGPQHISGWELLMKLKFRNESNLPRTYDIVHVEENRKQVYYLFHEYIQGATLEALIRDNRHVNINTLTQGLFSALASVHKNDFWFADLCEKNIFADKREKYFLIDLDSCQPASTSPSNDMDVNMVYWALVYKFYKEIIGVEGLKISDISGIALNLLQSIFLILQLKLFSLSDSQEYMSDQAFEELPQVLDRFDPGFRTLFIQVLKKGLNIQSSPTTADEIKQLIVEKICTIRQWPPEVETVSQPPIDLSEQASTEPAPEPPGQPVETDEPDENSMPGETERNLRIVYFVTNKEVVERGKVFTLSWQLENADVLRLYRNGKLFSQPGNSQTRASISEPLEETQDEVHYELNASNLQGTSESSIVTIKLKDDAQKPTIIVQDLQGLKHPHLRGFLIAAVAVLTVIILSWLLLKSDSHKTNIEITGFYPKAASEKSFIVILGKNIPLNSGDMQVYFNEHPGTILNTSPTLISVTVPQMPELADSHSDSLRASILIIIKKDTIRLPLKLTVRKKETQIVHAVG